MEDKALAQAQLQDILESIRNALAGDALTDKQRWHLNVARNSLLSSLGY